MSLPRRLLGTQRRGGRFGPGPQSYTVTGPYTGASPAETVLTQLHCHTNQSDGSYSPADVVQYYLDRGYGALQISDHDTVTAQPAGITTAITGVELSPTTNHIIATNSSYSRGSTTDAQTIIDGIVAGGGKAHVAHPRWSTGMTYAEMAALTDHFGLEIHNSHCIDGAGQNPVTYPGYAIDLWDQLLTNQRRDLWGVAVDDIHTIGAYDAFDVGRIQVFAADNTVSDIVTALVAGDFVADVSNYGMTPGFPDVDELGVALTCTGATRIEAWGTGGALLSTATGDTLSYSWTGAERYARLVAVGDYTEAFGSALSDRWQAIDGTWAVAGGVLGLTSDATARRIILRRHRQGDFSATVDMKLGSGSLSGCALMFNVLNATNWYMLRLGESSVSGWNNQLAVGYTTTGSFASPPLDSYAITAPEGTWYRVAMDYTASTGRIRAKVWDRDSGSDPGVWQIDVTDTHWRHGAFGLRANFAAAFDNLYLDGFQTFYQPIAVDVA